MKKFLVCLTVIAALLTWGPAYSEDAPITNPGNPVEQFTGYLWQKSTENEKQAFIFGIDTAIAIEYFISKKSVTKAAKAGKKPVYTLSPFEKGWMQSFKNITRAELVNMINSWYEKNPDKLDRPVLNVIWYEIIQPNLK